MLNKLLRKKKNSNLVGVDIGSSSIKLIELELSNPQRPKLVSVNSVATPANAIANHTVINTDKVAEAIRTITDSGKVSASQATICIPGPAAFTKRVNLPLCPLKDLQQNIGLEAGNYIPYKIDSIMLDFQVLGLSSRSMMEVLLVAVRNEVVNSYIEAVSKAGLEPLIADIDYFALENMFCLNYPEAADKTIALVNIGARYSTVNIIQNGTSLFTGDVSIGGRLYTDALCETLDIQAADAEKAKSGSVPTGVDPTLVHETLDRVTEHVAGELQRQIGFFWNATGTERNIDTIFLSGGGSTLPGLLEEIAERTRTTCELVDVLRSVDSEGKVDPENLSTILPSLGVGVGLGLRRTGDKKHRLEDVTNMSKGR